MRISHAYASATAPRTWLSFAISPSIWCAKSPTNDPSSDAASAPPGIPNICWIYWGRGRVNLDSLPCVDISPEANMGGPIDFKFSRGYSARVLVEMKRSSGTVVHGYEKQLEFYKTASQTDF